MNRHKHREMHDTCMHIDTYVTSRLFAVTHLRPGPDQFAGLPTFTATASAASRISPLYSLVEGWVALRLRITMRLWKDNGGGRLIDTRTY
ncbi:hypothetical protein EVAR_84489_1 [Eumeta japonica]|uniref:Uncharacterized protein n=1 Tax=Eumeta variegata TaxID=151549 RepID=A0A4C1UIX9_EUMVA|nr:hypothetical protein EVAR_84489_1 [Eumeta japonica]